tara:strand:- start:2183 stop:3103 length:921 start_codon:yes stop_codon:yes gene_type:complete
MASTKLPARLLDTSAVPALTVSGNLTVDTNTLHVDSSNNRVGIGETSPDLKLHVKSSGQIAKLETTASTGDCILTFADAAANKGYVGFGSSSSEIFQITNIENGDMKFDTNNTERLRIGSAGQIGIGGSNYGTSGQVLTSTGASTAPSWQDAGGGKLLQVVQTVKTDTWSSSTTATWVDITGLNVSITPASSSNKVMIDVHISLSNYSLASFRLLRGSTAIALGNAPGGNRVSATMGPISFTRDGHRTSSASIRFLDTPSTTSSTTYKLQAWTYHGTQYINRSYTNQNANYTSSSISTITASEISA